MKTKNRWWGIAHHITGILVVGAWATLMSVNVFSLRSTNLDPTDAPPPAEAATTNYYGVFYEDRKIGFAESSRVALEDGGARFIDRAYWKFKAQGTTQSLAVENDAVADATWNLKTFTMRVDAGAASLKASGRVEGDQLHIDLVSAGKTITETVPLDGPLLLPGMARAFVGARQPSAGSTFVVQIYNPIVRSTENMEIVVEGRDEYGWRIKEILRGSLSTTAWIDEDGTTTRELSPIGFEMRKLPREEALQMPGDDVPDLVFAVSVPVRGRIPTSGDVDALTVRLGDVDLDRFPEVSGGRQFRNGNEVTIHAPPLPSESGYTLPYAGDDEDILAQLASEPLIQSDAEDVVEKADAILGGLDDPVKAARKLSMWVYENVQKQNSAGVPSALEVLDTMAGDCNEHTVLFTALARASGIPTRMAAGLVYTHARGGGDGFYYHAWPEVWTGSDWIALDPTLGQVPADATHIRFVVGGLDRQVDILSLIGTLRADVVRVSRPGAPELVESPSGVEP